MSYLANKPGTGGGGTVPSFASAEIPSGTINGINVTFTLANTPSPAGSLQLFLNGSLQEDGGVGNDFSLSGDTITFNSAPLAGSSLIAYYMY